MRIRNFGLRAATIAEMLTVLVIIAILASLLITSIRSAKEKAKESVCISNIRQIQTAMALYHNDFNDYPPGSLIWPAFKTYYPNLLKCPISREDSSGEYDYIMLGSRRKESPSYAAWRKCSEIVGTNIPIVVDINHLVRRNPGDRKTIILGRENGGAISKTFLDIATRIHGPCEQLGLPFYYDF